MDFLDLCKSMNIVSTLPEYVKPKNVGLMFFNLEPNHIIIVSHLSADFSISQKGLWEYRAYSRRYRNRRIGEFLKEMHLTEERNTGFRKIRNALRYNGSPEPLFEADDVPISQRQFIFIRILRLQRQIKMQMKVYLIV